MTVKRHVLPPSGSFIGSRGRMASHKMADWHVCLLRRKKSTSPNGRNLLLPTLRKRHARTADVHTHEVEGEIMADCFLSKHPLVDEDGTRAPSISGGKQLAAAFFCGSLAQNHTLARRYYFPLLFFRMGFLCSGPQSQKVGDDFCQIFCSRERLSTLIFYRAKNKQKLV